MSVLTKIHEETYWQSKSLYVGDLANNVQEIDLETVFGRVNGLQSVKVCKDWKTGAHLGYGFLNFSSMQAARRALEEMNHIRINGNPCRLMWSTKRSIGAKKEKEAANIFVRNLSVTVDNERLHALFQPFGSILSAKVATGSRGESLGYGYVSFTVANAAEEAIKSMNGIKINGVTMTVERFVERCRRHSSVSGGKIFVGDIPKHWKEADLRKKFEKFGDILSVDVMISTCTPLNRGFGFIQYSNHLSALQAVMECNNGVTECPLRVEISGPKHYKEKNETRKFRSRRMSSHISCYSSASTVTLNSEYNKNENFEQTKLRYVPSSLFYDNTKLKREEMEAITLLETDIDLFCQ